MSRWTGPGSRFDVVVFASTSARAITNEWNDNRTMPPSALHGARRRITWSDALVFDVMAGEGPPSTTCNAGIKKAVDGRPVTRKKHTGLREAADDPAAQ